MLLFTYGTLRDPALMAELLGRSFAPPRPARLSGFRSLPTAMGYPALFPAPGQQTAGMLWQGLTEDDFRILDEYEQCDLPVPAYLRQELPIDSLRGVAWAWVYVGNPEFFEGALSEPLPD